MRGVRLPWDYYKRGAAPDAYGGCSSNIGCFEHGAV